MKNIAETIAAIAVTIGIGIMMGYCVSRVVLFFLRLGGANI